MTDIVSGAYSSKAIVSSLFLLSKDYLGRCFSRLSRNGLRDHYPEHLRHDPKISFRPQAEKVCHGGPSGFRGTGAIGSHQGRQQVAKKKGLRGQVNLCADEALGPRGRNRGPQKIESSWSLSTRVASKIHF